MTYSNLTAEEKLNMTLDEIYIEELKEKISKLENQKYNFDNRYGVVSLYDWIIHKDQYDQEYVSGYKYNKHSLWETSTIKNIIPMSTYLLVTTISESVYRLPYYSSLN